jgi:hypothetical protein
MSKRKTKDVFDLDALLHPATAFAHPRDVLHDPDLTLNEKRAILASWASDACAADSAPLLRQGPGGAATFDDVMDALRELDRQEGGADARHYRRVVRRRGLFDKRGGGHHGEGPTLN